MADTVNNDAGAADNNGPPTPQGSKEAPPAPAQQQSSKDPGVAADVNNTEPAPESAEGAASKAQQSADPPQATMRRVYSKQAMQAIFTGMGLPQLTITPAWEEGVIGAWTDTHGPIATELPELIGNLHRCQTLLEGAELGIPAQGYNRPTQRRSYSTNWTPMQHAAAYNAAYTTYAVAGHAAAIAASTQLPRHIRPIRVVPNQAPAHTSARPSPFSAAALGADQDSWGGSPMSHAARCSIDGSHKAQSSSSTATPTHAHSSTATPTAARPESLASTALVPGSAGWEASIKKLLGLQEGTSWLVQSPHITGSMGPIPAEAMAAWLLQGVPPRQLGRECHKPLLYATAADPAGLMVCGLMAGELERGIKPGRNAFKPLQELLPALTSGMDYSTAVKDLVWNRQGSAQHTASSANRAFTSTTSLGSSFSRGDLGTLPSMEPNSIPLPDTPTASVNTPTSSHGGDSKQQTFSLKSSTVPQLVSHLQQLPEDDSAGLTAAAKEIRDRARTDKAARELLVRENVVPPLVRLLQMPLLSEGQPQIAAAWALYYCMGRSKAAPQGCPGAAAAMDAAGAVKHATAVLKAVYKQAGSSGTFSEPLESSRLVRCASTASSACASASISPTQSSTKPEQQQEADEESAKVPARVQEAAVAVLAGLASTPSGKQAILDEGGAIPSIVRLLGSRCPRVSSAAVSTVRNLSDQGTFPLYTALFKAGASAMLVHVVSSNTEPACKQTALRVLLDLATAALSSTPEPADASAPASAAAPAAEAKQSTEEFTAANAVDRLVRRGLPAVLLKLLHTDPPLALQARAMRVLQLLAAHKPEEVLGSIRDLVSVPADGKDEGISLTGVQLLQRLMRSTSNTVKEGAVELLQALADAGMVGRGPRKSKS